MSQVPIAPSGLLAAATASTVVDLSWTGVAGVTGYQIDRRVDGGVFGQIGVSPFNAFQDTNASPNTAYLYRVRAVNVTELRSPLQSARGP